MASGVPQGSVLGPLLFAISINDLQSVVSSHVQLFADYCIIYRTPKKNEDVLTLQEDLFIVGKKMASAVPPRKMRAAESY